MLISIILGHCWKFQNLPGEMIYIRVPGFVCFKFVGKPWHRRRMRRIRL
jgi:hypothetical protein